MGKLLHLVAFSNLMLFHYYNAFYFTVPKDVTPIIQQFDHPQLGGFVHFTYWSVYMQTLYFTLCLFNDFWKTKNVHPEHSSKLCQFKDYVFCAFVCPMAFVVFPVFWAMYAVDRDLIYPKEVEAFLPPWLNHIPHTNVIIFALLDLVLSFRKYPARGTGIKSTMAIFVFFSIWTQFLYLIWGKWTYPIFTVLSPPMRILLMIAIVCYGACSYLVGEFLNNLVWSQEVKTK